LGRLSTFAIGNPSHVCSAVDPAGRDVPEAAPQLVCYEAKLGTGEPARERRSRIHSANRFGTKTLELEGPVELCMSALVE
jgi:hypothetical protein